MTLTAPGPSRDGVPLLIAASPAAAAENHPVRRLRISRVCETISIPSTMAHLDHASAAPASLYGSSSMSQYR